MGIITDVVLPLSLAFIMFSLGLALKSSDFTRVIKQPKDFLIGAFSQIIILPLVALIIVMSVSYTHLRANENSLHHV